VDKPRYSFAFRVEVLLVNGCVVSSARDRRLSSLSRRGNEGSTDHRCPQGRVLALDQARVRSSFSEVSSYGSQGRHDDQRRHTGFASDSGFNRAFKERFGCTPSEARGEQLIKAAGMEKRMSDDLVEQHQQKIRKLSS
jgi:hypothetical protein